MALDSSWSSDPVLFLSMQIESVSVFLLLKQLTISWVESVYIFKKYKSSLGSDQASENPAPKEINSKNRLSLKCSLCW